MPGHYHPDTCGCAECADDITKWGHRRMRNPDFEVTFTIGNMNDELLKLLSGWTQEELDTFRRNDAR